MTQTPAPKLSPAKLSHVALRTNNLEAMANWYQNMLAATITHQDANVAFLKLYESRAICRYLVRKYSFPLMPSDADIEAAALFDQAQSVEMSYFTEPAGRIAFEKFAKKIMGLPTNEAVGFRRSAVGPDIL